MAAILFRGDELNRKSLPTVVDNMTVHYSDIIMGAIASQITSLTTVYSSVYSDADQRKHQSSASLAFVHGIHRRPVKSLHIGAMTRKMFPFDDVIMRYVYSEFLVNLSETHFQLEHGDKDQTNCKYVCVRGYWITYVQILVTLFQSLPAQP